MRLLIYYCVLQKKSSYERDISQLAMSRLHLLTNQMVSVTFTLCCSFTLSIIISSQPVACFITGQLLCFDFPHFRNGWSQIGHQCVILSKMYLPVWQVTGKFPSPSWLCVPFSIICCSSRHNHTIPAVGQGAVSWGMDHLWLTGAPLSLCLSAMQLT